MLKRLSLLIAVVALLLWPLTVEAGEPVVRFFFFHSKTCPHCRDILENYLPDLQDKYGAQIEIRMFEISESPDKYRIVLGLQKVYGIAGEEAGVPLIFIGDRYLVGSEAMNGQIIKLDMSGLPAQSEAMLQETFPSAEIVQSKGGVGSKVLLIVAILIGAVVFFTCILPLILSVFVRLFGG